MLLLSRKRHQAGKPSDPKRYSWVEMVGTGPGLSTPKTNAAL